MKFDDLDKYTSDIDYWQCASDKDTLINRVQTNDYARLKDDLERVTAKKIVNKVEQVKSRMTDNL